MNSDNFKIARILIKIIIGMLTTLAVTSCVTAPQSLGPQLSPAPLPSYSKGTTFVYSDGRWETVTAVSPGVVTWSDYRGLVSSGLPDFTHRPSKWESKTRSVTRQFGPRPDLYTQNDTTLWPLRAGNVANYSETGTWIRYAPVGKHGAQLHDGDLIQLGQEVFRFEQAKFAMRQNEPDENSN